MYYCMLYAILIYPAMKTEAIDLFEHYHLLPLPVISVMDKYNHDPELTYVECEAFLKELKPLGYTFDYGLSGVPYNLRKIN